MRPTSLALVLGLLSLSASAQPAVLFGTGQAPVFREEHLDKRFLQTRLYKALQEGSIPDKPGCVQLVGGLLTLLGETAPLLHKRDENFFLDPVLVQALGTQLSTRHYPANAYFISMVRRVLIDKKLPEAWLQTATSLAPAYPAIDLGKLRFLSEGVQPVDNFTFTLPLLRELYKQEVELANASAASTAEALFRENYLDHQVAFTSLELVDIKLQKPPKKRRVRGQPPPEPEQPYMLARLVFNLEPKQDELVEVPSLSLFSNGKSKPKKRPVVEINARLQDKQFLELSRIPKGARLMARGRLWDYKKAVTEVELRDVLLFEDRDWSRGAMLADPNAVAACPLSVLNDLTGAAPAQPGAFGQWR